MAILRYRHVEISRSVLKGNSVVSDRAKAQIGYLAPSRGRRTDHQYTIETIVDLIRKAEIQESRQVRTICDELGWPPKRTDALCGMVDDVGFALVAVGLIEQW
jgi:hypothetical protein